MYGPLALLCFFRIHLPVHKWNKTSSSSFTSSLFQILHNKNRLFFFFFFFTSIVWSNSRPKASHAVILQQFYHFLPADSAETVDSQERSKRICHHLSLHRLKGLLLQVSNYCLCQCQWSGEDAIKVAGEHTSHCCLCSCGTDTVMLLMKMTMMMMFHNALPSANVWFSFWWMIMFMRTHSSAW